MAETAPLRRSRPGKIPTSHDAIDIAMDALAADPDDSPAGALLVKQGRLIDRQLVSENLSIALKLAAGLGGGLAILSLGLAAWNASRADGLVIKSFSVPPSLEARGLTGEAVASQLMDRLSVISEAAFASEPQRRMAGDLGQNVSIEIPQTGISLSQVDQWLKAKLGHEQRVTGEVIVDEGGSVRLLTRSGSSPLATQSGAVAELPALLQRAAEALYAREQPDSYATYLTNVGRVEDSITQSRARIATGSPNDQARAYDLIGNALMAEGRTPEAYEAFSSAVAVGSRASFRAKGSLTGLELARGHPERAAAPAEREPDRDPAHRS
jgi:hypothetical protein